MPNQLHREKSSYLRQHAKQAIEWMTWSPESLQKAKSEAKPILISIGYSACHWCQTMSRENFDDPYVATLMNRHFVCILVDREERPDLDQIYMEAVRMFNQSAGWPLHAFCLPSGEPFWGGTYFPKEDTGQGIAPWPQVLMRISEHFRNHPEELAENADNVMKNLAYANHADCSGPGSWHSKLLVDAIDQFHQLHDGEFGGFTPAPKFPPSMKIDFLLAFLQSEYAGKEKTVSEKAQACVDQTMTAMARGGIYDHLEGGFFRYSTDRNWSFPHFEKMILENSLLVSSYSKAYRHSHNPIYQKIVAQSTGWLLEKLGSPSTGFSSSVSAESDHLEGKSYLWEQKELDEILGKEEASFLIQGLSPIHGGERPLFLPRLSEDSGRNGRLQESIFPKLEQNRSKRKYPSIDEKKRVTVNAFVIKALVDASFALKEKILLEKAIRLAEWMKSEFLGNDSILPISYCKDRKRECGIAAMLDDFAYWAESLLYLAAYSELARPGSSEEFLKEALWLMENCRKLFRDEKLAGYFFSPSQSHSPPPIRKKFWFDNAGPSGNSSLLRVFGLLYEFTADELWKKEFLEARDAYSTIAQRNPEAISYALEAITEQSIGIAEIRIPRDAVDAVFSRLCELPHRASLIKVHQGNGGYGIRVKGNEFNAHTPEELFEILFS